MPKLSIITINLNNLEGLRKTIKSVFTQTFTDYEYIIIDGGSTDGSVDEIKKHQNKLVYWISEKDKGIYNAMNKGIVKAKGEYVMFMNSGDYLWSQNTLKEAFDKSNSEDIIYGDATAVNSNGEINRVIKYPDELTFKHFLTKTIHHTSAFIKTNLFKRFGLYNESLKIMSDWEFFIIAICLHQVTYNHVPQVFSCYNEDGISSQNKYVPVKLYERQLVLNQYFKPFYQDLKETLEARQKAEAKLRLYEDSRAHQLVQRLIHLRLYRYLKRFS